MKLRQANGLRVIRSSGCAKSLGFVYLAESGDQRVFRDGTPSVLILVAKAQFCSRHAIGYASA
jgi:hypothetical protein